MRFYVIKSDNVEGVITERAYAELRLQMSTGDFHTHTCIRSLPALAAHFGYTDIDDATGEFINVDPAGARATVGGDL